MSPLPPRDASTPLSDASVREMLRLTRHALLGASVGRSDYLWPKKSPCLALKTSAEGLPRGLAIFHVLLSPLGEADTALSVTPEGTQLQIAGETLWLELREHRRRVAHEPTPKEIESLRRYPRSSGLFDRIDLKPTGRFVLEIKEDARLQPAAHVNESGSRSFEEQLPGLILALPGTAAAKRARREERHRFEEEYRASQQLALQREQQRLAAKRELDGLLQLANDWFQAQRIREFVAAARRAVEQEELSPMAAQASAQWEARSLAIAARLDPIGRQPFDELIT